MKYIASIVSGSFFAAFALAAVLSSPAGILAQPLKVMTYNLRYDNLNDGSDRWELRREKVAALVRNYSPDIMGTQEGMHHQLVWLDSALAGYAFVGSGRNDGAPNGEFSAVFYRKNAFDMLEQRTFWCQKHRNNLQKDGMLHGHGYAPPCA